MNGKTYCAGVGLSKNKMKTLIIVHRDNLRKQWAESLHNMSGYSYNDIHEIVSTNEMYDIIHGHYKPDYDVYIMTHATFRAGVSHLGSLREAELFTYNLKIGMKIIDEAHLEFRDTLLMDAVMNVKRNLYLTATDARSAKDENAIFKYSFRNAVYYKEKISIDDNKPKKWVNYVTVAVNSHCPPNIYRYRVAGSRGMNSATYGKWVIAYDKNKTHFKACRDLVKQTFTEDGHSKMIIFMPLIDLCENLQEFLFRELSDDEKFEYDLDIRTMNSLHSKSENERAKKADVLITTIGSAGTGIDIPGITDIICCSPFVSGVTAIQVFGRIRYIPKKCHYYDIYDTSVLMDRIWINSRSKKIRPRALNVMHIEYTPDT